MKAVLVNNWEIVLRVPDPEQLEALAFGDREAGQLRRVLALGLGSAAAPPVPGRSPGGRV
jgi:hypothetical protein